MSKSKLKKDTLYRTVIALGYLGAMTLLIFSETYQNLILFSAGFATTIFVYHLIK